MIKPLPHNRPIRAMLLDLVDSRLSISDSQEYLAELVNLTQTAGGLVIEKIIQRKGSPPHRNKTYIGTGKLEEATRIAKEHIIDLVICNDLLKSNQMMYLQDSFKLPVWDKVDLILYIFEKHAKTEEAKLQIKLARLKYQIPRIYTYQATTLFERAGAGIGTRGAGEKGIEEEKRHLRKLIQQVEIKIEKVKKIRETQRINRKKKDLLMVAIVGYTNAGKSTFLRSLTNKKVYIADELFATLDTRIGRIWSQKLSHYILFADTIGFIRNLPPFLIESFKATLEEAHQADLILHIFDGSDPRWSEKVKTTNEILSHIGCNDIPKLYVANKGDKGCPLYPPQGTIGICALQKQSFKDLLTVIEGYFI